MERTESFAVRKDEDGLYEIVNKADDEVVVGMLLTEQQVRKLIEDLQALLDG